MDSKEIIVAQILKELTLCYINKGTTANAALPAVADSLFDAIPFKDAEQVHEVFKRARNVESIPTQKTLNEAWRNIHEEFIKYESPVSEALGIGYDDPRSAWLPKDDLRKRINLNMAIKNYCAAFGGELYMEYCRSHHTRIEIHDDRKVPVWDNVELAMAFDSPIKDKLRRLYTKYIRRIPMYESYPRDARLNLGLIPPTVRQFKVMIEHEAK